MRRLLFPSIAPALLPRMLLLALAGGVVGAIYGGLHDAVTFRLSPEYFTLAKFPQFAWADLGAPAGLFAVQIGAIASGAVGLIAAWFLARTALPRCEARMATRQVCRGFLLVLVAAAIGGGLGALIGSLSPGQGGFATTAASFGARDPAAFARVASIHWGSYLGGFTGLLIALAHLRRGSVAT